MLNELDISQIKNVIGNAINNNEIAGANLLIIKDGKEIFYHEDGLSDKQEKKPIQRDTIFRLYSMSKPITAAAVMILLERGEIDLYEPVSKYLSGFKNQMVDENGTLVPVKREANIKDLLCMTSGLVYGGVTKAGRETEALFQELDQRLFGDTPMTTLEFINKLGNCPLFYHPGESWEYGTSADALGALVEVVSGMRFGEFLEKEIFKPLGMKDTGFFLPAKKRSRLAKTYAKDGNGGMILYTGNHLGIIHQMDREPAFESGGAGLVSTIDDYSKFSKMLLNGGSLNGVQILRPKTVEYMTNSSLTDKQQESFRSWNTLEGHSYGNLMRVMTDVSKAGSIGSLGEYGWGWLAWCIFLQLSQR